MPSPPAKIAVFWDLESCPPPTEHLSSRELLKNIRHFTSTLGIVTSIRAYWDPNKKEPSPRTSAFRADMLDGGVTIVDCSLARGYNDGSLARMLTVDVLVSAIDHPTDSEKVERNIIMIISGNESVLYPVSLLVFRNYTVYVVVPDETNGVTAMHQTSFRDTATRTFSWHKDILGRAPSFAPTPVSVAEPRKSQAPSHDKVQKNFSTGTTPTPLPRPTAIASAMSYPGSPRHFTSIASPLSTPKTNPRSTALLGTTGVAIHIPSALSLNPEATAFSTNSIHKGGSDSGRSDDIRDQMLGQLTRPLTPETATQHSASSWRDLTFDTETPKTHSVTSPLPPQQEILDTFGFEPLIQFMREALAEGRQSVLRSNLGTTLAKIKYVYKQVGVSGFGQYVTLAEQRGLITLGGAGGKEWIALSPRLRNDPFNVWNNSNENDWK